MPLIIPAKQKKWLGNVWAEEAMLSEIRVQYRLKQK